MIHPTALIHESAVIGENVSIGPWTIIGANVVIGAHSHIASHVVINGPTTLGTHTKIFQFASIGEDPQDLKFHGEETRLEVGDNNTFREFTTVHRGTGAGGGVTRIGNHNLFMAYVHIAHDCIVGDHNIFANNASLSGHVMIEDYVTMSGFSAVRQFTRVGVYSFVAGGSMVVKDVLPYLLVSGDPAEPYGLNAIGLQRNGFSAHTMLMLRKAYKLIFRRNLLLDEVLAALAVLEKDCVEVKAFIDGIRNSARGIARETRRNAIEAIDDID